MMSNSSLSVYQVKSVKIASYRKFVAQGGFEVITVFVRQVDGSEARLELFLDEGAEINLSIPPLEVIE